MARASILCLPLAVALVTTSAGAAPPVDAPEPSSARFRGGVGILGGVSFRGPGAAVGLQGRFGAQFNDMLALYLEPEVLGGGGSGGVLGLVALTPVFEATFADRFFVGAGPCLQFGAYASNTGNVEAGLVPGAKLKLGAASAARRRLAGTSSPWPSRRAGSSRKKRGPACCSASRSATTPSSGLATVQAQPANSSPSRCTGTTVRSWDEALEPRPYPSKLGVCG